MKIAHEAPVSAMNAVQQVTDYDYALSVCFDKVDGYYDFFKNSKARGRTVLLDNGIFEEGVPMESGKYANYIAELLPDEYVVPDALEDMNTTVTNFNNWLTEYGDLPGKRIGVVQGKTLNELVECYKFMSDKADKIAISFDYSLYINEILPQLEGNKWMRYCRGRAFVFDYLHGLNILNTNKPHHLLGISLPCELRAYAGIGYTDYIESFDSSNPVVYGIKKGRYPSSIYNVTDKISTKLKDLINTKVTDEMLINIISNINQFRYQNELA